MADRFFTPDALTLGDFVLKGPEAHHLSTVRRFQPGDRVSLFNGDGSEYHAEVIAAGKKNVHLQIYSITIPERELDFSLVVASALPKGDCGDFLIEKLTELGVSRFIPLLAERSVVRPKNSIVEKFHRAVIEASKQCGRNKLMAVEPPCELESLLERSDLPEVRIVLHSKSDSHQVSRPVPGVVVAIGPEGGFTAEEIDKTAVKGWQTLSLGPRILRVETAAIAAASMWSIG